MTPYLMATPRHGWSHRRRALLFQVLRVVGLAVALVLSVLGLMAWVIDLWLLMPVSR